MSGGRVIALGGPPGSGKTTAARALAAELSLELVSAGDRFRAAAARRALDLEAFSRYAESHPEVDRELDAEMAGLARPGRILEGRLTGPLLRRRGVPVRWLAVVADAEVRAERLARRDGRPLEEARRRMAERERSEHARYRELYGIDLEHEAADYTVDSSRLGPAEVVAALRGYLTSPEAEARGR